MPLAPEPHRSNIITSLSDPHQLPFGQVATVEWLDGHAKARVRTVRLYYLDKLEAIGFCTSTLSRKWFQLEADPFLAGCYFDAKKSTQLRWEGAVELVKVGSSAHEDLLCSLWRGLDAGLRAFIWDDYCRRVLGRAAEFDVNEPCPAEGVVACRPERWTILKLDTRDFSRCELATLVLEHGSWKSVPAPVAPAV